MRVLLTNDDGVQSEGMAAAREALLSAGISVITVGPDGPRSGTARSASFRKAITITRYGGDESNPIYAVDGTPTDSVRAAILSRTAEGIDAVVSGINEGANLGDDATYSSTLGAAIEGALLGYPAIAASQQARDGRFRLVDLTGYDYDTGAKALAHMTRQLIEGRAQLPLRSVLNLNAPGKPATDAHVAQFDHRRWTPESIHSVQTEGGIGWVLFGTHPERDPVFEFTEGSDAWVLRKGGLSVTPVNFQWQDPSARRRLARFTRQAVARLNQEMFGGHSD